MILRLYPNGTAPLTAILSKLKSEKVTDPEFAWWTKSLANPRATVLLVRNTAVFTGATPPQSPYVSGGVAGTILFVSMSAADALHFRAGMQVLLRVSANLACSVNARVLEVGVTDATFIRVILLEPDNRGGAQTLAACDTAMVVGTINAEGAAMPAAISYNPVKFHNFTQIFRTPLSITRTAMETKLRYADAYQEMKREALELHSIEMEKAFLFGVRTEGVGANGKPERTSVGIIPFLREFAPTNLLDYTRHPAHATRVWTADGGGELFLDNCLELVFRQGGRQEKLALCGSGALLGINRLIKASARVFFQMSPTTKAYGVGVTEWVTPFGSISLKTHPLFSIEPTLRHSILILEPENLRYRFITDTKFYGEGTAPAGPGTSSGRVDAKQEEFLTECGLEFHHPATMMFLNGVGLNSVV